MDEFIRRYVQAGQTSIANYLLDHFQEVGMSTDQLLMYLQLRRLMDRGDLLPAAEGLATHLGWDTQKVYQVLHEMITEKLMVITSVTDKHGEKQDTYDFRLLTEKLSQLPKHQAQDEAKTASAPGTSPQQPERATVFNQIEQEFGRPLSPIELQTIGDWLDQDHYRPELIQLALKESVLNQVYSLKYMDRILLSWEKKNLKTAVQVQRARERQTPTALKANTTTDDPTIPDIPIFKLTD